MSHSDQLSEREANFLMRLRDDYAAHGGWAICKTNPPNPAIQGLVNRGYCRLSPARCGPLGVRTGEVMVGLTEAGTMAIKAD